MSIGDGSTDMEENSDFVVVVGPATMLVHRPNRLKALAVKIEPTIRPIWLMY